MFGGSALTRTTRNVSQPTVTIQDPPTINTPMNNMPNFRATLGMNCIKKRKFPSVTRKLTPIFSCDKKRYPQFIWGQQACAFYPSMKKIITPPPIEAQQENVPPLNQRTRKFIPTLLRHKIPTRIEIFNMFLDFIFILLSCTSLCTVSYSYCFFF